MPEQLDRDLASAIQSHQPERISDILHHIRRTGPVGSPERIALVEPLLAHEDWTVRQGALFALCSRWQVPHLRAVARAIWESDPEVEVRSAALLGWASYDEAIGNPKVAEALLQVMLDQQEETRLRGTAWLCLLSVCRVPPDERPRISSKIDERTDWALVWRLVGGLGVDLSPYRPPPGAKRV